MTVLRQLLLWSVLSLLVFACSPKCEEGAYTDTSHFVSRDCSPKCEEGAFECLKTDAAEGVDYLICAHGQWVNAKCDAAEICRDGQCLAEVERCQATQNACLDEARLELCVKGEKPSEQVCDAGKVCDGGQCVVASCVNHRQDEGEVAVDCGGACAACVDCRVDGDCGVDGLCDSALGYVCSKRCRTNEDCTNTEVWDGNYCRVDGRCSPKVFETVWEVPKEDPKIVLPFDDKDLAAKCDFQILWGDEPEGTDITALPHVTDCGNIVNRTHEYAKIGRYSVKIIGIYDAWGAFDNIHSTTEYFTERHHMMVIHSKLRGVTSFGPVGLGQGAFYGATMLDAMPKIDVPDASKLKSLANTFRMAAVFNAPIGHWDTSRVTDMRGMFYFAEMFDQPIGAWDTSSVTDMSTMFQFAAVFNQPIGSWDTSKVSTMSMMFRKTSAFDQPLASWDTSNVTTMGGMFGSALAFDQDLSKWILKSGVELEDLFESSGMSEANLCGLKAVGDAWLGEKRVVNAVCE